MRIGFVYRAPDCLARGVGGGGGGGKGSGGGKESSAPRYFSAPPCPPPRGLYPTGFWVTRRASNHRRHVPGLIALEVGGGGGREEEAAAVKCSAPRYISAPLVSPHGAVVGRAGVLVRDSGGFRQHLAVPPFAAFRGLLALGGGGGGGRGWRHKRRGVALTKNAPPPQPRLPPGGHYPALSGSPVGG